MFRPCLLLLPAIAALSTGCSTPYSRLYSPAKSYYKAPAETTVKVDADKLLGPADAAATAPAGGLPPGTPPGELPPASVPMPMGEVPAADPLNLPGAAPAPSPAPTPVPPL